MNDLCPSLFRRSRDLYNTCQSNINKHVQVSLVRFPIIYFLEKCRKESVARVVWGILKIISVLRFLKHFLSHLYYLYELMKSAILIQRKKWDIN